MMPDKKDQVFVISQIGSQGHPIRKRADVIADYIVKPVAQEFDLETLRSDRDPTPGPITPQILNSILDSRVVVADLTGKNPNVYYELCFAQSFGIPVVMLVDHPDSLPFDVKDERVIAIGEQEGTIDMAQGESAKKELKKAFEVVLREGYEPRSLITDVAGVQNIERMSPGDPVAAELSALNRRVDQIYERVSSRGSGTPYRIHDLQQLMDLVTTNALEHGVITRTELNQLIDDTTSPTFDQWVRELIARLPSREEEEDFDDIPF